MNIIDQAPVGVKFHTGIDPNMMHTLHRESSRRDTHELIRVSDDEYRLVDRRGSQYNTWNSNRAFLFAGGLTLCTLICGYLLL